MDKPKEILCPQCGGRLTGTTLTMIETALESEEAVDFAVNCPLCGKMITRRDIELVKDRCRTRIEQPVTMSSRGKPPWEDMSKSFITRLIKTLHSSLFTPTGFFRKMSASGGKRKPMCYALFTGILGIIFSVVWSIMFWKAIQDLPAGLLRTILEQGILPPIASAGMLLAGPFFIIIMLFIWAGILHLFLMMVKGTQAGYETTFRVLSYSYGSTAILNIIPFFGWIIEFIWQTVLLIIGLKEVHSTSGKKAAFAVLIPSILGFGIVFLCL